MRPDPHGFQLVPNRFLRLQVNIPFGHKHFMLARFPGIGDVFAARDGSHCPASRIREQFPGLLHSQHLSLVDHADPVAHPEGFIPVMGDHNDPPVISGQKVFQFHLQFQPQVCIQRGKRLVQHQQFRFIDQNPPQSRPLCLTAGKLPWFQSGNIPDLQQFHHLVCPFFSFLPVFFSMQTTEDILPCGHVRKQCIVLEQISHAPLPRRQIDLLLRIEKHPAVQHDPAAVRLFNPGNACQRHALAAAGSAQKAQKFLFTGKRGVQMK